ncbi:MAG: septum formation protein Maf [Zetaproteobacteria bacterium]|nr:septum formation protein Maf [Zetaproteobacteria bacterium]
MEVILASKSPRRLQLLQCAGLAVEVMPSHIDETPLAGESVADMVMRLCRAKAQACPVSNRPIIAADTLVSLYGEALGQPEDLNHAKQMLQQLSGQRQSVLTAVCVRLGEQMISERVITHLTFRPLSDDEIDVYLMHNDVLDKAGAYAIQAGAASFITQVDGALDNVMGLPIQTTCQMLKQLENLE